MKLTIIFLIMSITAIAQQSDESKRSSENVHRLKIKWYGYSTCARCELPNKSCEPRYVTIGGNGSDVSYGAWAVCTYCWPKVSLDEIITHYKTWFYKCKYQYKRDGAGNFEDEYSMEEVLKAVTKDWKETH